MKIVGYGQLPDLCVKLLPLHLVNLGVFLLAALKHTGCAFKMGTLLGLDHRRVNPEPVRQFRNLLLAL